MVDVGGPVAQVGTGYLITCAVLANTKMRCWGDNKYKQVKPNDVVTLKIGDQPGEMPLRTSAPRPTSSGKKSAAKSGSPVPAVTTPMSPATPSTAGAIRSTTPTS
ncbi:hypothetical protein [Nannocystis pusilla]|uniref:hypothetical protein n=1 Tax=Nannocystis pusilla TaxID=889268 RepID=UPI003B7B93EC